MKIKNSKDKYGIIAIIFHWFMALLIIGMLSLGIYMVDLPVGLQKIKLYGVHKEFGVLVLMLVTLRVAWRLSNIVPFLPAHLPNWQKLAARMSHFLLYVLMFAMPMTGWLLSSAAGFPVSFFGLFLLPNLLSPNENLRFLFTETHKWLGFGFIALIGVHVAAVLQHYVMYRENILKRILPWK